MDSKVRLLMVKGNGTYQWVLIDIDKIVALEVFEAGNLVGAYAAMDRYKAEAEDAARVC